jgi:hypothetical protein
MEKLSAGLQAEISARPLKTILLPYDIDVTIIQPTKNISLPSTFDGRIAWEGLITPAKDQGTCGSCWAFASTGMLADRFNIQSMGIMNVELSQTKLILCDWQGKEIDDVHPEDPTSKSSKTNVSALKHASCFGNSLVDACRYLYLIGTPTEECVPYTKNLGEKSSFQKIGAFEHLAQLPLCSVVSGPIGDMCSDFNIDVVTGTEEGTPERFYRALHFYRIGKSEHNIRNDIYKWGPIATGMQVYPDFYTFDPVHDIYEWDETGPQVGGHAIEIVGWGVKGDKNYWIVKNSWGPNWGINGYFLMSRGVNTCKIEENCMGMVPDFFYENGYTIANNELLHEQTNLQTERTKIDTILDISAGGIDPTTGFTRRVMITMPWLNLIPPIEREDLPEWNHFIAARDATIQNRARYQATIRQKNSDIRYSNQTLEIYVTVGVILIIFICFILILMWRK